MFSSLISLWIYTALKLTCLHDISVNVWYPYEFTLLSNNPYLFLSCNQFDIPMNLHCSQTVVNACHIRGLFDIPMNLHCSQTQFITLCNMRSLISLWLYTALKLSDILIIRFHCLISLWIYTALKLVYQFTNSFERLISLWIYTALKPSKTNFAKSFSLISLWIYTALKLQSYDFSRSVSLISLWIYTALKRRTVIHVFARVWYTVCVLLAKSIRNLLFSILTYFT